MVYNFRFYPEAVALVEERIQTGNFTNEFLK
jgi:hypothetical protein